MKPYFLLLLASLFIISCQNTSKTDHISDHPINLPELFLPGIVSSEHMEFSMAISPIDAKTVFFTRRVGTDKQKIYQTVYQNGQWSIPKIAPFSTNRDESPHYSADGRSLYFGSERSIPNRPNKGSFDMNVWKTTLNNDQWSNPIPLPPVINKVQVEGEEWPIANLSDWVTNDDQTFYTGTWKRGEKGIDLFKATFKNGIYTALEKLPKEICREDKWEYAPMISPDGQYLFFQVYNREDGKGGDDVFVSKKGTDGQWLPSVNLGDLINTNMNECPSAMTSDGKYFFFTRDKKENPEQYDGIPSIYIVETSALKLETLF